MKNWIHYPKHSPYNIYSPYEGRDEINFNDLKYSILAYGQGKSYGDCCFNDNNILISTKNLNKFIHFDTEKGCLTCESGVTLSEILDVAIPAGWFLPVLPGTQHVTVGGAIANDIHGKNHHKDGTFGLHVIQFELLKSDGMVYRCSNHHYPELYHATIGGLGLTGIIISASLQLKRIINPFLNVRMTRFNTIEELLSINNKACEQFEYTVAWLDPYNNRGHYLAANHHQDFNYKSDYKKKHRSIPFYGHHLIFNPYFITLFNQLQFNKMKQKETYQVQYYQAFFFPLDSILHWNRIYGKRGFLQYQCVIPTEGLIVLLDAIKKSKRKTSLMVIKSFSDMQSPGLLSFPKEGMTLAMDFANPDNELLALLDQLDDIVISFKGRVNPAKDARMSPKAFKTFFPAWETFQQWIDPQFSSSFWRRVTGTV